ncbi:MAG: HAD-IB family hydrolase [Sphingomonadales bacterium]|nr:HAD-IB family hydrolase [Sphingomonadales bacterium]MBD3775299.1 HAD-IB family hydrolase [Paracoccaceae bacterium]
MGKGEGKRKARESSPDTGEQARRAAKAKAGAAIAADRASHHEAAARNVEDIVAAIEAGPQGPKTVVIFDFDGTLIAGYSANVFLQDQIRKGQVGPQDLADLATAAWKSVAKAIEMQELLEQAIGKWGGRSDAEQAALGEKLFEKAICDRIYPEMARILAAHRRAGHTIAIASSATRYQVEPAARFLGVDHVMTSVCEVDEHGILTGNVLEPQMWGVGKANAVKAFVKAHKAKLADTWFYADGDEEIGLMEAVGHPVPTNPGRALAAAAGANGWGILRHGSRGSTTPELIARTATGLFSLMPLFYSGFAWSTLTRDKRAGANMAMPAWADTALLAAGVSLNVTGRRNLRARRPAVFLFNHRNNFDALIVASLVRTDFAGVGKTELKNNPLSLITSQLMPMVFVERAGQGAAAARKAMQPAVDMIGKGYSIVIAPEGTRVRDMTVEVGVFKKGAFHMAMAAGVPVIPIVIRNALDIGARDAKLMRSGKVDVAVLPPIATDDWDDATLDAKIAGVRQLYIDTLRRWPDGE